MNTTHTEEAQEIISIIDEHISNFKDNTLEEFYYLLRRYKNLYLTSKEVIKHLNKENRLLKEELLKYKPLI